MRARWIFILLLLFPVAAAAQETLTYHLRYAAPDDTKIHVSVALPRATPAPIAFVMPRTVPGGYSWRPYDGFVENLQAYSEAGAALEVERASEGPRWTAGKAGESVARFEYDVNIARMEQEILDAGDSSRVRPRFAGFLGYSIFGYPDGHEEDTVRIQIEGPAAWPVFTTLAPRLPAEIGTVTATAPNFYALADSQILMGPDLQLRRIDGRIPLFIAIYAETEEDLDSEGKLARDALDHVSEYFKGFSLPHYTVHVELLRSISPRHTYTFSMEHQVSGTFVLGTARAITRSSSAAERETNRFNYAHHMAHSWVPKQVYGVGYLPFTWEFPPIIDTIWFNEGFGRYSAIEAMCADLPPKEAEAYRQSKLDYVRGLLANTPPFIRRMPLDVLSRTGSFLYGDDWRIGQNLFSRGSLMAAEMDDSIRARTEGKKSLRDALTALLEWSRKNHRGFRIEEFPGIISSGTGVDVADILKKWSEPLDH